MRILFSFYISSCTSLAIVFESYSYESDDLHDILYFTKLAFTVVECKAIDPPGQIIRSLMICHMDQKKLRLR